MYIVGMKNLEESQFSRRLRSTRKKHFEILASEIFMKWKNLKRAQEMRIDEFSLNELRESHATIRELASHIQELQERMNYMNDSLNFKR